MNIDPREWELQERAMREDPACREVASALRRSPGEPPADFAASMAAMVAGGAEAGRAGAATPAREGEIERWLVGVLSALLGLAGIRVLAGTAREWLGGFDAFAAMLGGPTALNWAFAAAACVALSWAFTQGALRTGVSRR